ncbi:MAG TPA: hypothetical protein VLB44_06370 [Kofleriaceae bacterium]|nr:hypothetical protein [Kofleriaceae bacterium]
MATLLMNSPELPETIRGELRAAQVAGQERRTDHLLNAARMMNRELTVDCEDALELVGLPAEGCGC